MACSLLIAAFAVAAVAVNADARGLPVVGTDLWVAAGVLAVVGVTGGGWRSLLGPTCHDDRRPQVAPARSTAAGTVTVGITERRLHDVQSAGISSNQGR